MTAPAELDLILGLYEARPPTHHAADVARHRAAHSLGRELNRIQGAKPSPIRSRLVELVILGKATPKEVMEIGAELARRGLLAPNADEVASDFRR